MTADSFTPNAGRQVIGILGGTGDQGRGLGLRLAVAGHDVILGSRDVERATAAAQDVLQRRPGLTLAVRGASNADAAASADTVIAAVPYDGHRELLSTLAPALAGKIVVDCVNPLEFDKRGAMLRSVPEGSSAEEAHTVLPESRVVSAFHDVSAKLLLDDASEIPTDVLVCGDDEDANRYVAELASAVPGMRGVIVGPLRLSCILESLTCVLVGVNRRYKTHSGVRITGV
ncbi:MAG: NADPH-dependent F420 reductase [Mycobacteriales bacterium]|nr:NADPH-dependent F420 reductase [Frankia sp.]